MGYSIKYISLTGILLTSESGQVDGIAVDDQITHAADVSVPKSGRPQAGRDGSVINHHADTANHEGPIQVKLI